MPLLRPSSALSSSRPSIRALTTFLLSPPTQQHQQRPQCTSLRSHQHQHHHPPTRRFSTHPAPQNSSPKPRTHDRGPPSKEDTQTDFNSLDVLGNTPAPSTAIDACLWDGFHLNSGVKIGGGSGALLVAGEAFAWRPWEAAGAGGEGLRMVNAKGQFEVPDEVWGVLELVWPKPDLLILGLGKDMRPLSPKTRERINSLGIRIDIQDTRNAAAQFNLLATERGVGSVAAALVPLGWREGVGVK